MKYKNWKIEPHSYLNTGYEAYNEDDCDAAMIYGKTIEEIIEQIDDYE